jgi:hypothetical protein
MTHVDILKVSVGEPQSVNGPPPQGVSRRVTGVTQTDTINSPLQSSTSPSATRTREKHPPHRPHRPGPVIMKPGQRSKTNRRLARTPRKNSPHAASRFRDKAGTAGPLTTSWVDGEHRSPEQYIRSRYPSSNPTPRPGGRRTPAPILMTRPQAPPLGTGAPKLDSATPAGREAEICRGARQDRDPLLAPRSRLKRSPAARLTNGGRISRWRTHRMTETQVALLRMKLATSPASRPWVRAAATPGGNGSPPNAAETGTSGRTRSGARRGTFASSAPVTETRSAGRAAAAGVQRPDGAWWEPNEPPPPGAHRN